MSEVSERLRILREQQGESQRDVARAVNLSDNSYSKYENGKRGISSEMLKALAVHFSVSADYLLGIIDEPRPIGAPLSQEAELIANFRRIPDISKGRVCEYAANEYRSFAREIRNR